MSQQAHITSVEALESFRASLILYLSKARPVLEEVSDEVTRTKLWLENDQRIHWEREMRKRKHALQEAEQALFSAKLTNLRETRDAEIQAVKRAKRALTEAEEKLRTVKRWNREFEHSVLPLLKQLEKLHTILSHDMKKGTAYLARAMDSLEAYANMNPGTETPSSTVPEEPAAQEEVS